MRLFNWTVAQKSGSLRGGVLRGKLFVPNGKSSRKPISRTQCPFHIAHESKRGVFTGKVQPAPITSSPEGTPIRDLVRPRKIIGSLRPILVGPVHELCIFDVLPDIRVRSLHRINVL